MVIRYPQAGAYWQVMDRLRLGASLRGQFVLEFQQAFSIAGDVGGASGTPVDVLDGVFGEVM